MDGSMIKAILQNSQNVLEKLIGPTNNNNNTNVTSTDILSKLLKNSNDVLMNLMQNSLSMSNRSGYGGDFVTVLGLIKNNMYYQMIGKYEGIQNNNGVMVHVFNDESRITLFELNSIDIPNITEYTTYDDSYSQVYVPSANINTGMGMNIGSSAGILTQLLNNSKSVLQKTLEGSNINSVAIVPYNVNNENIVSQLLNNSKTVLQEKLGNNANILTNLLKNSTSVLQKIIRPQSNNENILTKLLENSTSVLHKLLSNSQNNFSTTKIYKRWVDTFNQIQSDGGVLFKIKRSNQTFKENLILRVPNETRFIDAGPSGDTDDANVPTEPDKTPDTTPDTTPVSDSTSSSSDAADKNGMPRDFNRLKDGEGKAITEEIVEIDREKDRILTMYDHPIQNIQEINFQRSDKTGKFKDTSNRIDVILEKDGKFTIA